MADESSFDIVSKPDMAEVKNALLQVEREIETRYDFRDSISEVKLEGEKLLLKSEDEYRMSALVDVLQSKLLKRGVDIKFLEYGKVEPAAKVTVRQEITIKTGIPTDKAKQLIKLIKDKGWKVNAQIQDQQVRVSSKSKDDLQLVIAFLKTDPLDEVPLQVTNFR